MFEYEIFSYWLFIWFLFYYCGLIKASPLFFLIIGLLGVINYVLIVRKINENKNLIKMIIKYLFYD